MTIDLPTYIPLNEATRRYRIGAQALTQMVEKGTIRAVKIDGSMAVAETDIDAMTLRDGLWAQVKHLDGTAIGVKDARCKYYLGAATLSRWIEDGIVRVLRSPLGQGRGRKKLLNEADIAYASLVADKRGRKRGRRILTPEYLPPHLV